MRKHRRKSYYRPIAIAAIAVGAVGVPSAAMACLDTQGDAGGRPSGHWEHVSSHKRWTGSSWGHGPTAGASKSPTAAPSTPQATASPSAPATTAPASGATARVLTLVNNERSKAGCSPLTINAKLTKAAQDHSKDMASHQNMSHTGSDGSSPGDRITRAGLQLELLRRERRLRLLHAREGHGGLDVQPGPQAQHPRLLVQGDRHRPRAAQQLLDSGLRHGPIGTLQGWCAASIGEGPDRFMRPGPSPLVQFHAGG